MNRTLTRLISFALGLLFFFPTAAHVQAAKPTPEPKIPPQPVPCTLSAKQGDSLDIPLRIYGIRRGDLEYRIRSAPSSGTLSAIRALADGSAAVTYTPHPNSHALEDRFSYAVKTRDGVSASAEVNLKFVAKLARIVGPSSLEFPPTALGESTTALLDIKNIGDGPGIAELQVPAPWSVAQSQSEVLEPGTTWSVPVVFAPKTAGRHEGTLAILSPANRSLSLTGQALPDIEFWPSTLVLEPQLSLTGRSAEFFLINNSSKSVAPFLQFDPRLHFTPIESVPPKSKLSRTVTLPPGDVAALDCRISLSGHPATLSLRSPPLPARLEFLSPSLEFGSVFRGVRSVSNAKIRNTGGQTAITELVVGAPFRLSGPDSLQIPPLTTLEIPVVVATERTGPVSATLHARTQEQTLSLPMTASVRHSAPSNSSTPHQNRDPERIVSNSKSLTLSSTVPPFRPLDGPIEFQDGTVLLHWRGDLNKPLQHRAEWRRLVQREEDQLEETWVPIPEFEPKSSGEFLQGAIHGAPAGRINWVRIVPVDHLGAAAGVPWLASFRMPDGHSKSPLKNLSGWGAAGIVAAGIWGILKRRRARRL